VLKAISFLKEGKSVRLYYWNKNIKIKYCNDGFIRFLNGDLFFLNFDEMIDFYQSDFNDWEI